MSDRAAVLSRFPDAVAEHDLPDLWAVFDIPVSMTHGVRWNGDVSRSRGLWGCGHTEDEAWNDARRSIELHEGKLLTATFDIGNKEHDPGRPVKPHRSGGGHWVGKP